MIKLDKTKIITKNQLEQDKFYAVLKIIDELSQNSNNKVYMGIDFEFNTKKMALMQILFQIHIGGDAADNKIIKKYFIIYPPILSKSIFKFFKYNIFSNINILKILHGSESLDIPYIVDEFYDYLNELELIIDFFKSMIDTRYLCEYLNIITKKSDPCKIYDLLLTLDIIDQAEKERLELNEEKMGKIYNIKIDIHNLSPELILYAIHDVVYLVDAYLKLLDRMIKINPKDYYLLLDCIRYSFLEKRYVSNIGDDKVILDSINNHFYYLSSTVKINLIKSYDIILNDYKTINVSASNLLNINFIKSNINNLLKLIVYSIILKYYKVYVSNDKLINYNLNNRFKSLSKDLELIEFNHLNEFISRFYYYVNDKLTN